MPFETGELILMATFPTLIYTEDSHHNVTAAPLIDAFYNIRVKRSSSGTLGVHTWHGRGYKV